jgi:streptogramin lyase
LIAPSGMVFFTAQGANYIGRINPEAGNIKVAEVAAVWD